MRTLEEIRKHFREHHYQLPVIVDNKINPDPVKKPEKKKSSLYLMYNQRNRFFKIGRSKDPKVRERTLQGEDPETILIHVWVGHGYLEKDIHKEFSSKRIRGEWFNLDTHDSLMLLKLINDKIFGE